MVSPAGAGQQAAHAVRAAVKLTSLIVTTRMDSVHPCALLMLSSSQCRLLSSPSVHALSAGACVLLPLMHAAHVMRTSFYLLEQFRSEQTRTVKSVHSLQILLA